MLLFILLVAFLFAVILAVSQRVPDTTAGIRDRLATTTLMNK